MNSPEQVHEDYRQAFGPNLGDFVYALWNEVAWLNSEWQQYCDLYAKSKERIDLLNLSAPFLFRLVHDVLWDDIILGIARLTGPVKSAGKDNLSLQRLPRMVDDPALAAMLKLAVDRAVTSAAFAKDRRDRRLAHRDLTLALDPTAVPLAPASRAKVRAAIHAINVVFDALHIPYIGSRVAWDLFSPMGGSEGLIRLLEFALEERRKRKKL